MWSPSATHLVLAVTCSILISLPPVSAAEYQTQQYSWYKDYYPRPSQYCFQGCYNAISQITFDYKQVGDPRKDYQLNECANVLKINSTLYCAQKYCTPHEREAGPKLLATDCEKVGVRIPTVEEATLSASRLAEVLVLDHTAAVTTAETPLGPGLVAIPDAQWHALGERTVRELWSTWDLGFYFTFALAGFWILVIGIGTSYRVLASKGKGSDVVPSGLWTGMRRSLIYPAALGHKQAEPYGNIGTIPPRLESFLLLVYVLINIAMCFPGYHVFDGNQYYTEKKLQLARYIADRTGFLSFAQLPMVWVFASRNDPLLWLTGWSFATFNRFHRLVARLCIFHAVIHSIAYTAFADISSSYASFWSQAYWKYGVAGTVIGCFMLVASSYFIRERYYDFFLAMHITLSVFLFVTLWYHVIVYNGEFNYYLYPCIAMWILDRLLRLGRMIMVCIVPRILKGSKATITYDQASNLIRIDVSEFLTKTKITPGVYYYLYVPKGLRGYESHPFTLCSWRRPSIVSPPQSPSEILKGKETHPSIHASAQGDASHHDIAHTLLIRPYKGMTARLRSRSLLAESPLRHTIFLEGPYGTPTDLSSYSEVLFICGGSGITAAISHSQLLTAAKASQATRLYICWALPQRDMADALCAHELADVVQRGRVKMTVHVTAENNLAEDQETVREQRRGRQLERRPTRSLPYELEHGRPDVESVMRKHRKLATRNLAVVTCGPPQFSDACRAAVVKILGEEGVEVGWFDESLTW